MFVFFLWLTSKQGCCLDVQGGWEIPFTLDRDGCLAWGVFTDSVFQTALVFKCRLKTQKRSCFFILNEKTGAFFYDYAKKTAKTSGNEALNLLTWAKTSVSASNIRNSERVYLRGSRDDIRVPLREIRRDDTYTVQRRGSQPADSVCRTPAACTAIQRGTTSTWNKACVAHPHCMAERTRRYRNPAQKLSSRIAASNAHTIRKPPILRFRLSVYLNEA